MSNIDESIFELQIPVRLQNALEAANISTIRDLLNKKPREVIKIKNIGEQSMEEIFEALEKIGFYRRQEKCVE